MGSRTPTSKRIPVRTMSAAHTSVKSLRNGHRRRPLAPRLTARGIEYALVQANAVTTYAKGQVYLLATPSSSDTFCVSLTTGSENVSVTYTGTAGSGKFAAASGTLTA